MQKKTNIIIGAVIGIALITLITMNKDKFYKILNVVKQRIKDAFGSGLFGASRRKWDGTKYVTYKHQGIDIITIPGENVYAPFDGVVTRHAKPNASDPNYSGIEIKTGTTYVKMFYINPSVKPNTTVKKGDKIAVAQDISKKYSTATEKMTNHLHAEVRINGKLVDPTPYFI